MSFHDEDLIEKQVPWKIGDSSGQYTITKTGAMLDHDNWAHIVKYKSSVAKRFVALESSELKDKKVNLGNNLFISVKRDGEFNGLCYDATRVNNKSFFVNPNGRIRFGLPVNLDFEAIMKKLAIKKALFVGELWYYDPQGKRTRIHDFIKASRTPSGNDDMNQIVFDVFDVIILDDGYFLGKAFDERYEVLQRVFPKTRNVRHEPTDSRINLIFTIKNGKNEELMKYYLEWVKAVERAEVDDGEEGIVVRTSKTNKDFKIKPVFDIDCVIIGYLPNLEDSNILSTLLVALITEDGKYQLLGKVGGGFSSEDRVEMLQILKQEEVASQDVIITSSDGRKFHLTEPRHVIKVKYMEIIFEDSRGEQRRRLLASFDAKAKTWSRIRMMPFVSLRSPRYIKEGELFRDDKKNTSYDVGINQITRFFNLELPTESIVELPRSETLLRLVKRKTGKKFTFTQKELASYSKESLDAIATSIQNLGPDAGYFYSNPEKIVAWINTIVNKKSWGGLDYIPEPRKSFLTKLVAWKTNKGDIDTSYPHFVVYFLNYVGSKDLKQVRNEPFKPAVYPCADVAQLFQLLTRILIEDVGYDKRGLEWQLVDFKNNIKIPKMLLNAPFVKGFEDAIKLVTTRGGMKNE